MIYKILEPKNNMKPFLISVSGRGSEIQSGVCSGDIIFDHHLAGTTVVRPTFSSEFLNLNSKEESVEEKILSQYYIPYYSKIDLILSDFKKNFKKSIFLMDVNVVPSLGHQIVINGSGILSTSILDVLITALKTSKVNFFTGSPIFGDHLVRRFGNQSDVQAVQLNIDESLTNKATLSEAGNTQAQRIFEELVSLMYMFGKQL